MKKKKLISGWNICTKMKTFLALSILSASSLLSLDQYTQPYNCPNCSGGTNYQNPSYQNTRPNLQPPAPKSYESSNQQNSSNSTQLNDARSDTEIENKIRDKLSSGSFKRGFENVDIKVHNGNVLLSGAVNTLDSKNLIEEALKKIEGVKQVNNQVVVVKVNYNTFSNAQLLSSEKKYPQDFAANAQDRQLNAKIRSQLNRRWVALGYDNLVVKTTNGIVEISGIVNKPEDIQKIANQIRDVDGIKSVDNQLSLKKDDSLNS